MLYQIRWCQNWKITFENHDWFDLMEKLYPHCDMYFFPSFMPQAIWHEPTRICKAVSVSYSFGNLGTHRVWFESSDLTFCLFMHSFVPLAFLPIHWFSITSISIVGFQVTFIGFAMLNLNRKINLSLMQSKSCRFTCTHTHTLVHTNA